MLRDIDNVLCLERRVITVHIQAESSVNSELGNMVLSDVVIGTLKTNIGPQTLATVLIYWKHFLKLLLLLLKTGITLIRMGV